MLLENVNYFEKHCDFATKQAVRDSVDVLSSLMEKNTIERIKEQEIFNKDLKTDEANKAKKAENLNAIKAALKSALKKYESKNESSSVLTTSDLVEIDNLLESNLKNVKSKGTRFTHAEKLQHTQDAASSDSVTVLTSSSEEV